MQSVATRCPQSFVHLRYRGLNPTATIGRRSATRQMSDVTHRTLKKPVKPYQRAGRDLVAERPCDGSRGFLTHD